MIEIPSPDDMSTERVKRAVSKLCDALCESVPGDEAVYDTFTLTVEEAERVVAVFQGRGWFAKRTDALPPDHPLFGVRTGVCVRRNP